MTFSKALMALKSGSRISRRRWTRDAWIYLVEVEGFVVLRTGDVCSRTNYMYKKTKRGYVVVWTPTHADILAEDWMILHD